MNVKNNLHENMKNTFNQLQNEEFKNENHMIFMVNQVLKNIHRL